MFPSPPRIRSWGRFQTDRAYTRGNKWS